MKVLYVLPLVVAVCSGSAVWNEQNCNKDGSNGAVKGVVTDALCVNATICHDIQADASFASPSLKEDHCNAQYTCLWLNDKCVPNRDMKNNVCAPEGSAHPYCTDLLNGNCPDAWQVKRDCCKGAYAKYDGILSANDTFVCCNLPCKALEESNKEDATTCSYDDHAHCAQCGPTANSLFGLPPHPAHGVYSPAQFHARFGLRPAHNIKYGSVIDGFGFQGIPQGSDASALESIGVGRSREYHTEEITVDDLMSTLIDALDKDDDVFEFNKEINSDPWFGKQEFAGKTDRFSFIDPYRFVDKIYGSPFGLSQAKLAYSKMYGAKDFKKPAKAFEHIGKGPVHSNSFGYQNYNPNPYKPQKDHVDGHTHGGGFNYGYQSSGRRGHGGRQHSDRHRGRQHGRQQGRWRQHREGRRQEQGQWGHGRRGQHRGRSREFGEWPHHEENGWSHDWQEPEEHRGWQPEEQGWPGHDEQDWEQPRQQWPQRGWQQQQEVGSQWPQTQPGGWPNQQQGNQPGGWPNQQQGPGTPPGWPQQNAQGPDMSPQGWFPGIGPRNGEQQPFNQQQFNPPQQQQQQQQQQQFNPPQQQQQQFNPQQQQFNHQPRQGRFNQQQNQQQQFMPTAAQQQGPAEHWPARPGEQGVRAEQGAYVPPASGGAAPHLPQQQQQQSRSPGQQASKPPSVHEALGGSDFIPGHDEPVEIADEFLKTEYVRKRRDV